NALAATITTTAKSSAAISSMDWVRRRSSSPSIDRTAGGAAKTPIATGLKVKPATADVSRRGRHQSAESHPGWPFRGLAGLTTARGSADTTFRWASLATSGVHVGDSISCLIVDDHEVVREGLRLALSRSENIRVVGEAADGTAAVALARRRKPNVVILDV